MIKKWMVTIPELTGKKRRKAYIYLPESYKHSRKVRYPVLYMFDGHNVFFDEDATYGKSWGMKEFMDNTQTPLIIVAVECNHGHNNERLSEYSPYDFEEKGWGRFEGKGKQTMDWFVNNLKPYIDSHYRTLTDRKHTMIAGSSMGGLMSIYALLHYNHIFSKAAALSPALGIAPKKAKAMIEAGHAASDSVLYVDFGSEELAGHKGYRKMYGQMISMLLSTGIMVDTRIVPGGNHSEASWERQIPFFMNTMFYDLNN